MWFEHYRVTIRKREELFHISSQHNNTRKLLNAKEVADLGRFDISAVDLANTIIQISLVYLELLGDFDHCGLHKMASFTLVVHTVFDSEPQDPVWDYIVVIVCFCYQNVLFVEGVAIFVNDLVIKEVARKRHGHVEMGNDIIGA